MTRRLTLVPGISEKFGLAYWEPFVDGRPLRELLAYSDPEDHALDARGLGPVGENVPVLVHNWPVARVDRALQLLGEMPSELTGGRVPLYVCAACADLACGAVSVAVERTDREVVWHDFGWDTGWDDGEEEIRIPGGPFVFDRDQHDDELRRFVDTYDAVRAALPDPSRAPAPAPRRRWWPWPR
ncbi:hypothetical protein AB6N23_00200 [Cellulomonas sp. 179-A 9B4 NHS]|uniref:hypothetical protein n=1 Tax=Cellulomonas sp. 179-A 9B4 NHS TaxID=3142379 RepID=UPI0039A09D7A